MITKVEILFLGCVAMTLLPDSAIAQRYSLPEFESYPVAGKLTGRPAPVDINSHPKAQMIQTQLEDGPAKGCVNFAGHYTVVSFACGAECKTTAVIDARSGKVMFMFK